MKELLNEMVDLAAKREPFVLATLISHNGSTPRSTGAKMLIRQDGSTAGTIGGGILEDRVEQLAVEVFLHHSATTREYSFTGKDATTMDAICGGQVEVLVEWLDASEPGLVEFLDSLSQAVASNQQAWVLTALPSEGSASAHTLVYQDGKSRGALPVGFSIKDINEIRLPGLHQIGDRKYFIEPLDIAGTVYIFGAGHVSRSLAEFTKAVGFRTIVLDDRIDYVNSERFPTVDQLIVLDNFSDPLNGIQVDRDSFVVIVTRGHLHDRTVLTAALRTKAGYIGMIGSSRKCGLLFDELRRQGFTDDDLRRVHAPIGLSIEAETPEEIGISIVAEMIQARARMKAGLSGKG